MKLNKLIKKINKENAPPDGWKPEDDIKKAINWDKLKDPKVLKQLDKIFKDKYEKEGHPYYASARLWDDGVISPLETRSVLAEALRAVGNAPTGDHQFPVFRM